MEGDESSYYPNSSVTKLGKFMHFGQLFKARYDNYFAQIAQTLGNF